MAKIENNETYEGCWNSLASTSTEKRKAQFYAGNDGIVFVIQLDPNNPHPHA